MRRAVPAVLLGLALAAPFVAASARIDASLNDDAFITYRYAANAALGRGLVYNPGEPVLGTTTPGYALLLAAGARLVGPGAIRPLSRALNAGLGLTAAALAAWTVAAGTGLPVLGALAAGAVLLSPSALFASLAGMESPLFVLFLVVVLTGLVRGRPAPAAWAAGLLPLVRPEGAAVTAAVGVALAMGAGGEARWRRLLRPRTWPFGLLARLAGPGLAWAGWATFRYGSPVPQSVRAKVAGIYPVPPGVTWRRLAAMVDRAFLGVELPGRGAAGWTAVALTVLLLLAGGLWLARRRRVLVVVPAVVLGLFALYGTSGTLLFPHYVANFEALALLCAWGAVAGLAMRLRASSGREGGVRARTNAQAAPPTHAVSRRGPWLTAGTLVLLPSLVAFPWRSVVAGRPVPGEALWSPGLARQAAYRRVAADLGSRLPPDTRVALPEIGELGFYLPRVRVLDTEGLVSPEAVPFLPVPAARRASWDIGAIPPGLILRERPDMLVTLEVFGRRGILDDPEFRRLYTPVRVLEGPWLPWTSRALFVFSRNDFAPGMALAGEGTAPGSGGSGVEGSGEVRRR